MTPSDRELLEKAAKAAGLEGFHYYHFAPPGFPVVEGIIYYIRENDENLSKFWNSLADDGDCARLETALNAEVTIIDSHAVCEINSCIILEEVYKHDGDKNKARRYASTRCAAAIGETL